MKKTLLVTNDFPPHSGGIETYLEGFARQLDPERLIVYASTPIDGDWQAYDAATPWTTVRNPTATLLPNARTRKEMQALVREHEVENVWFGSSTPLGILADAARKAGARHVLASTHGHEIGWSMIPGARQYLAKVFAGMDTITYIANATLERLRPRLPGSAKLVRLPGGIDAGDFAFDATPRNDLRTMHSIGSRDKVVLCASRLVKRKGQDMLIRVWPEIARRYPGTRLVIVGTGPYESRLRRLADSSPARPWIVFAGDVKHDRIPGYFSMADIFAMPCRTRRGGLEVEGLGIVYLEAAAAGLPVVAGDSGGASEALIHSETGMVASGRSATSVLGALTYLLDDTERARAMGALGRAWVAEKWRWDLLAQPLLADLE